MTTESAVRFATESRAHIALAVRDIDRAVAFYGTLFGLEPTKRRPRYARFEVDEPPLNLALNEVAGPIGPGHPVAHLGIQVQSSAAVARMAERLAGAGLGPRVEEQVTCCFAVQDKVWAADPDGNPWEVYVVTDDAAALRGSTSETCCTDDSKGECCSGLPAAPACGETPARGCCGRVLG